MAEEEAVVALIGIFGAALTLVGGGIALGELVFRWLEPEED